MATKHKESFLQKGWVIGVLAMVCCFLWGSAFPCIKIGYSLFSIAADDTASQILFAGLRFTLAGLIMIVAALVMGGHIQGFALKGTLLLIYMALISAVAYSIWSILLKHNPVGRVAVYGFLNPVCGVILSAILLKEQNQAVTMKGFISLVLVCIGIYMVNKDFSHKTEKTI